MSWNPDPSTPRLLWGLARPRGALWVATLPLLGFAWGHWDRALTLVDGDGILLVMSSWVMLHAGTMWLNAALDRDQEAVLYGEALPVPEGIVLAGYGALAIGVIPAVVADPVAGACAAGCALLAILYSHPRTGWKGHPVLGPAVNAVGYGILSTVAGWWLVQVSANLRTLVTLGLLVSWILGCYLAAQVFQEEEDRRRGYGTPVVALGAARTLDGARILLGGAVGTLLVLAAWGWYPRATLLAAPAWMVLDRWVAREDVDWTPPWARGLFRRLVAFGLLLVVLVTAEYARESVAREPVAGLGTAAGHPPDRPLLPPPDLRRWEARRAGGATGIGGEGESLRRSPP